MPDGGPPDADAADLLRKMLAADDVARSRGERDAVFAIIRVNGGQHFLDHKGLDGVRPEISQRSVVALREAGAFQVLSEAPSLLRVYLAPAANAMLATTAPAPTASRATDDEATDTEARLLIQAIFDRFAATGQWPQVDELIYELDQADVDLDVTEVGRRLDAALGSVAIGADSRATLTIHGVAVCEGSTQVLADMLETVRLAYERFRAHGSAASISKQDLVTSLGFDEVRTRRTYEFMIGIRGFGGGTGGPGDDWRRSVTTDITKLKRVATAEGLLAAIPRRGRLGLDLMGPTNPAVLAATGIDEGGRSTMELANLHGRVGDVAGQLFMDGHYAQAVFEAMKAVELRLREMAGLDLSGRDLAAKALGTSSPTVLVSRHHGRTGLDEQEGLSLLAMGALQALRNPGGHEIHHLDRAEALDQLAVASLLLRRLDTARKADRGQPSPNTSR